MRRMRVRGCLLVVLIWYCAQTCLADQTQIESVPAPSQPREKPNQTSKEATEVGGGSIGKSGSRSPTSTSSKKQEVEKQRAEKASGERCEYEKGPWEECQSNGVQRRSLRLKNGTNSNSQCEPIKTIERHCRLVGCKYARGEWSSSCVDGKRSRVDVLLGALNSSRVADRLALSRCPARRTVSKDCRRTCHYIKSAWSECSATGWKTRNLTLSTATQANEPKDVEGSVPANEGCLKDRIIKRQCRARELINKASSLAATPDSIGAGSITTKQSSKMPPATRKTLQKRRLQKQQRLQQQLAKNTTSSPQLLSVGPTQTLASERPSGGSDSSARQQRRRRR